MNTLLIRPNVTSSLAAPKKKSLLESKTAYNAVNMATERIAFFFSLLLATGTATRASCAVHSEPCGHSVELKALTNISHIAR
jgi:hypothetical protein